MYVCAYVCVRIRANKLGKLHQSERQWKRCKHSRLIMMMMMMVKNEKSKNKSWMFRLLMAEVGRMCTQTHYTTKAINNWDTDANAILKCIWQTHTHKHEPTGKKTNQTNESILKLTRLYQKVNVNGDASTPVIDKKTKVNRPMWPIWQTIGGRSKEKSKKKKKKKKSIPYHVHNVVMVHRHYLYYTNMYTRQNQVHSTI